MPRTGEFRPLLTAWLTPGHPHPVCPEVALWMGDCPSQLSDEPCRKRVDPGRSDPQGWCHGPPPQAAVKLWR